MILRRVTFQDFGVYAGQNEFELAPRAGDQFSRPIVLFSGKNGAGKTTFVEGVRLCLHGSLALGARVSRRAYEEHLLKRIHRPFQEGVEGPDAASIKLEFEIVRNGDRRAYVVERAWHRTPKGALSEQVHVTEDGDRPEGVEDGQEDSFLRELVPPSTADLFFFDGERVQRLTSDEESTELLKETVQSLLGLHLVDRLETDLDVYVSRRASEADSPIRQELDEARADLERLRKRRESLQAEQEETREAIEAKHVSVQKQRQEVEGAGGEYANRRNDLEQRHEVIEQKIEAQKGRIQDLADGIMPFAVAPTMCRKVVKRLDVERQHQEWKTSEKLIEQQSQTLENEIEADDFWNDLDLDVSEEARSTFAGKLKATLKRSNPAEPVDESEVIIHASEREQGKLNAWIDEALNGTSDKFAQATQKLASLNEEQDQVEQELARVPEDLILQPLVETLNSLIDERDELQEKALRLADDLGTAEFKIERAENHLDRVKERLEEEQHENERVQLALRTQRALRGYAQRLREKKLALLEDALTKRFNQLSRKASILDDVTIDAETFAVTLHRNGETFERAALSAGEKQIFAIATIWGLREVSGVPMPVIIDTPLARLDGDHRKSIIETYLPRASHQVIPLATDTEMDKETLKDVAPALSHGYQLDFDEEASRTIVKPLEIEEEQPDLFESEPEPALA